MHALFCRPLPYARVKTPCVYLCLLTCLVWTCFRCNTFAVAHHGLHGCRNNCHKLRCKAPGRASAQEAEVGRAGRNGIVPGRHQEDTG